MPEAKHHSLAGFQPEALRMPYWCYNLQNALYSTNQLAVGRFAGKGVAQAGNSPKHSKMILDCDMQ